MTYLYLVFQQLIASTTHIVAQHVTLVVDPGLVLLFRASGAAIIFFLVLWVKLRRPNVFFRIERCDWRAMVILAILNIPLNQLLYLHGMHYTSAANGALLYALTPAIVLGIGVLRRTERLRVLQVVGITVAISGTAILMFESGASLAADHVEGDILVLAAVIAWSFYTVLGAKLVRKYGALYVTAMSMILGAIIYLPIALATTSVTSVSTLDNAAWLEFAYLAVMSSVVNYALWFYALERLSPTRVAVFQNLQPVLTTVLALILGEIVLTHSLVGGGSLALIGVALVQFGR